LLGVLGCAASGILCFYGLDSLKEADHYWTVANQLSIDPCSSLQGQSMLYGVCRSDPGFQKQMANGAYQNAVLRSVPGLAPLLLAASCLLFGIWLFRSAQSATGVKPG
jgi:hypothetical protein